MHTKNVIHAILIVAALIPAPSFATTDTALLDVFATRGDLQLAFDPITHEAIPGSSAGFLIDLEDWAWQYGWREYPELAAYAPTVMPPERLVAAAPEPLVTADAFIVLDRGSAQVLSASRADMEWPIASLTKLVTTHVALESGISLNAINDIRTIDDVGGAKLYVDDGATFTTDDLFYATLVGSANNAANAVARSTGLPREEFLLQMNAFADSMHLPHTTFVDPTGIEVGNVSTAREYSRIANRLFANPQIKRYTTTATAHVDVLSEGETKNITNTNWMLWKPEYDDIFVMGGKTGFLDESGWNLAVALRPELTDSEHEILIVLFGANSRAESFTDAEALARWTWANHMWK